MKKLLYKWKKPVPYAYVPRLLESVSDRSVLLGKMSHKDFDPHQTSYFLSREIMSWRDTMPPDAARIHVKAYETDMIALEINLSQESYIVTADAWMPGWKARLENNAELPLFAANNAFRCFKAPSGKHTVAMYYQPASFTYGIIISMISLALWLGLVFYIRESGGEKQKCV
jgi:uncharacterized membrane protein YfhO